MSSFGNRTLGFAKRIFRVKRWDFPFFAVCIEMTNAFNILLIACCSLNAQFVYAKNSDFKPFEFLSYLNDPLYADRQLESTPLIKVQSELSDGLGWEGQHPWSVSKALHVVVSVSENGKKEAAPIPGLRIRIRSQSPLPCIVEQGNERFDDCSLTSSDSREFITNMMGRVSFSVPLDGIDSFDHALPPIWIQSGSMANNEW